MKTGIHNFNYNVQRGRALTRTGSAGLLLVVLTLAGCGSNQAPNTGAKRAQSTTGPSATAVIPAGGPGQGTGFSNYGAPLTKKNFVDLTLGNTLFRPLADGGKTRIFVSQTGDLTMRVTSPAGQTVIETGKQSVNSKNACWTLKGQSKPLCFRPYWNGRLMTLLFNDSEVQPAQFLIEQGDNHTNHQ